MHHYGEKFILVCNKLDECKNNLRQLLANGLAVKAKQAQLALDLTTENHLDIREAIMSLNGLQKRYDCLDGEGVARAMEIGRLQARIQHCNETYEEEHDALQRELDELQERHKLKSQISQCNLLRKGIQRALREGGSYKPASLREKRSKLGGRPLLILHDNGEKGTWGDGGWLVEIGRVLALLLGLCLIYVMFSRFCSPFIFCCDDTFKR